MSQLTLKRFSGPALNDYIEEVARLRIAVFRHFPYLYDGDMAYEAKYLRTYTGCRDAVVVLAFDGARVVGASTGIPMVNEEGSFRQPFEDAGYACSEVFYCAESVLEPAYRGRGLGVRFFEEREAHAREAGNFSWFTFCSVMRPADHPLRPAGYRPLDAFWRKRGYTRHPELRTRYRWKDIGQAEETSKTMEFWLKSAA